MMLMSIVRCQSGELQMRLLFGIILGAALTVGAAYISDTAKSGADARPMVNWDVVAKNFDTLTVMIKQGWAKLIG
jgi:hypothetical protein